MDSTTNTIKAQLTALNEPWTPLWESVARHAPTYAAAYAGLRSVPHRKHHLSHKIQELILLAIDASCTHLFAPGIKLHTSQALKVGARKEEVLEVLQLASVLGIHSTVIGVPTLVEVLQEEGKMDPRSQDMLDGKNLGEYRERLKADFQTSRGYWSANWDHTLALDPEWFQAYTEYSSVPFRPELSCLSAKEKELIFVAIDVSTTHMFQPGLKIHVRNAVRYGATAEEILEVYELAGLLGAQTVLLGVQALDETLGEAAST